MILHHWSKTDGEKGNPLLQEIEDSLNQCFSIILCKVPFGKRNIWRLSLAINKTIIYTNCISIPVTLGHTHPHYSSVRNPPTKYFSNVYKDILIAPHPRLLIMNQVGLFSPDPELASLDESSNKTEIALRSTCNVLKVVPVMMLREGNGITFAYWK